MRKRKTKEVGLLYDAKRDGELVPNGEVILICKNGTRKRISRRVRKHTPEALQPKSTGIG